MSRREKQPSRADANADADAEPHTGRTTRQKARRAATGSGDGSPSAREPQREGRAMSYDTPVQPHRTSARLAQARAAASAGQQQVDARNNANPSSFGRSSGGIRQPTQYQRRYQGEVGRSPAQEWQDVDPESPAFTSALQTNTPRSVAVDKDQERTDTSRDPSTDNGDSSGNNSLEVQQWSDTDGNNRPASASETGTEGQGDVPCRVSWCEHAGKRYGLCWAHGGVKKCCHRNCPKIALATGEFCSLHEREVHKETQVVRSPLLGCQGPHHAGCLISVTTQVQSNDTRASSRLLPPILAAPPPKRKTVSW
ncbi:putative phosphoserine aminotransferase [Phytophthora cinnamomi]|uniref:putative phosphoserine aminotransferase n=1 Tax=Phytophthora cinnamomi TaxID=4785 RepID=UPI00355AAFE9|nr:putative phosphoserine aminotransferase [Phytophthora cinnamomi]